MNFAERFNDKWTTIPETSCHWWTAYSVQGYGHIRKNGKWVKAHRVSYELNKGKIPSGMCVCHTCDNPECVNPDHLFLGTQRENIHDCIAKNRFKSGIKQKTATHCVNGHLYDEENTFYNKCGKRCCRICSRKSALKTYYKNKEKYRTKQQQSLGGSDIVNLSKAIIK